MKDRPDCGVLLLHNSDRDEFSGGKEAIGDDLSGMTMSISTLLAGPIPLTKYFHPFTLLLVFQPITGPPKQFR